MRDKKIDYTKLNEVLGLSKKILNILYITLIIAIVYVTLIIFKETKIVSFILTILSVLLPAFIGLFVAWLFDPFVKWLQNKGIKRWLGTTIVYVIFLGVLSIIVGAIIPVIYEQINDLVNSLPAVLDKMQLWIDNIFKKLDKIEFFDA